MPTIEEILNGFGTPEAPAEKTASAKDAKKTSIEQQARDLNLIDTPAQTTKTASVKNGGEKMNLKDLYESQYSEKTAAAQAPVVSEAEKVASLEAQGEIAGAHFQEKLGERLVLATVKLAMESVPDSAATQERNGGPGIVPGAKVENPQLPVNRPADADKAMDTTPDQYDLKGMSGAVAKAKIEAALASGNLDAVTHKAHNVDTGLEMPTTQKTASLKLTDLSKAQLELLSTKFPEEMMKQAHAIVAEENEKVAELQKVANDCYSYGAELAMQKIAEMEEKAKEEKEEDEEEEKEESEEEKTASAMGDFILEGFWNTLMEKGAEFYGDQDIYIEELIKEAKMAGAFEGAKKLLSQGAKKVKSVANKGVAQAKAGAKKGATEVRKQVRKNPMSAMGLAAAGGAGAGYAASKKD